MWYVKKSDDHRPRQNSWRVQSRAHHPYRQHHHHQHQRERKIVWKRCEGVILEPHDTLSMPYDIHDTKRVCRDPDDFQRKCEKSIYLAQGWLHSTIGWQVWTSPVEDPHLIKKMYTGGVQFIGYTSGSRKPVWRPRGKRTFPMNRYGNIFRGWNRQQNTTSIEKQLRRAVIRTMDMFENEKTIPAYELHCNSKPANYGTDRRCTWKSQWVNYFSKWVMPELTSKSVEPYDPEDGEYVGGEEEEEDDLTDRTDLNSVLAALDSLSHIQ